MQLKDILVMEVPFGALKVIAKNKDSETKLNSIEDAASFIAEQDETTGKSLANEFKFAGNTAVNLNIAMKGIGAEWHNKEFFKNKLIEKFTEKIFLEGLRPTLDKTPQLISSHDLGNKVVLAFSFLGTPRRYLENFQIVSRSPQIVEYVVIHFSPFAVEVRAGSEQNIVFRDSVIDIMGIEPKEVVWDKATKLTEQQANDLSILLGAKLRAAKHKMIEGPYATKEVTAHTKIEDLEIDEQYKQEFSNQPMKKKTLVFEFEYSFGYADRISYVITEEGLWIRSKAGEEVIAYILDRIIQIRYPSEPSETLDFDCSEIVEEEIFEEQLTIDI